MTRISFEVPDVVYPGGYADVIVHVEPDAGVVARELKVTLDARETALYDFNRIVHTTRWLAAAIPQEGWRGSARFLIPPWAPPTFEMEGRYSRYRLEAEVRTGFFARSRALGTLRVGLPAAGIEPPGKPVRVSAAPPGAGDPSDIELSLAGDVVAPGGTVHGQLALYDLERNRYGMVSVSLLALITRNLGERDTAEYVKAHEVELSPPAREARPLAFELHLPAGVAPTYGNSAWQVSWEVEVRARTGRGADRFVRVPIHVVSAAARATASAIANPPPVGDVRLEAGWRQVAQRAGLAASAEAMTGRAGVVDVTIGREILRGERHFAARLRYPSLGLLARTRPRGDGVVDITARDLRQATWLRDRLLQRLRTFQPVTIDDETAWLCRHSPGYEDRDLAEFVDDALDLAARVVSRDGLPAPEEMVDWLDAWREVATLLGGELDLTRIGARGHIGAARVAIETGWNEQVPALTRLVVQPPTPMRNPLPEDLARLRPGVAAVRVVEQEVTLELPFEVGDPRPHLDTLRALAAFAESLSASGPYR